METSSLPAQGCALSPLAPRAAVLGSPGLQSEKVEVNLDGIAGCFDHSLSIKLANEAGVCGWPPGTGGSWARQWGEGLSVHSII